MMTEAHRSPLPDPRTDRNEKSSCIPEGRGRLAITRGSQRYAYEQASQPLTKKTTALDQAWVNHIIYEPKATHRDIFW